MIGCSLTLHAARAAPGLRALRLLSRETLLLLSNAVLLVAATGRCCWARSTRWCWMRSAWAKISVGPPYYTDTVFVPPMAPLVFLMGVGRSRAGNKATLPDLWTRLRWALGVAIVAAIAVRWATGEIDCAGDAGPRAGVLDHRGHVHRPRRARARGSIVERLKLIPRAMVGMMVAHVGIAVFIHRCHDGQGPRVERDVKMDVGDSTTVRDVTFTFKGA